MKVGVPKETAANERRVALVPETVGRLVKGGLDVLVERGAGSGAFCPDDVYAAAGGTVVADRATLLGQADVVLKVQGPAPAEVALCREGAALVALFQPGADPALVQQLAARKLTTFSLVLLPRITRAQPMDALSSQATVAGYKAVLLAASASGRFLPMLAVVSAFDVRPAVKEQVESLGARFLAMEITESAETAGGYAKQLSEETHRRELAFIGGHVKDADIVITTAQIPGKRAPILITQEAVAGMKPGSVIVDLAAEAGGNCEVTEPGTEAHRNGVAILGPVNLPATLPLHASQMYAKNVSSFLLHLVKDGRLELDFTDQITRDTCVTHAGEVRSA
jgi:NAD(P) transhydrogenase subunit alpha